MHALEPSNVCLTEYPAIELFKFKKRGWSECRFVIVKEGFVLFSPFGKINF